MGRNKVLIGSAEAADILGVTQQTVRNLAACFVARRLDAYADTPDGPQPVFLRPEDLPLVLATGLVVGNVHDNPDS